MDHLSSLDLPNDALSNLSMNSTSECLNPVKGENPNESDLTVIAESYDDIRRISLAMYVGDKILNIYVLDPAKCRPTLFFKSLNPELTVFEKTVQNKKMTFINYSSVNLLFPTTAPYLDTQPILQHVLNNLIPRIKLDQSENENSSDSNLSENEDEYFT